MDHSWGYGSDQRLREENQDSHGVFELPEFTLAVVCDGMGGHVGGAQASALAVRTIHDTLMELQGRPVPQALEQAIERTNLVIYEAARKNHRLMGMGTTAVVAAITHDACYLAHVGDSRAYLLRHGQVQQLTRDHTMVNLFVDAELLSPEDAATHPEAHVLSRSLGVERQVDVELASPIRLEPGDVVFLCSDGVHGVVTDWELANVEWGAPHAGVQHVLSIVATREGDDNATAVAVLMGTSFEDVPATHVPEPRRFDDVAPPQGGVTAVPAEDGTSGTLGGYTQNPSIGADSGYVDYGYEQGQPPLRSVTGTPYEQIDQPDFPRPNTQQPVSQYPPQPLPHQTTTPPPLDEAPPRPRKQGLGAIPVVIASLMLLLAVVGVLVVLLLGGTDNKTTPQEPGPVANDGADRAPIIPPVVPDEGTAPPPTLATAGQPEVDDEPMVVQQISVFDTKNLPDAPRRIPHRPEKYTQPPPGGQLQYIAVSASRRRDCAESLDAVQRGMKEVSIDHAVLHKSAWLCFDEAHQRPLEQVVSDDWDDFRLSLVHLEGTPEDKEMQAQQQPEIGRLPSWYRPAVGGLEYRLEQFTADEQMEEVMLDLIGEQKVADALYVDLYMEARAALGLSRIRERTPSVEHAWARRVYVLASALAKRPGRLLDEHRNTDLELLRTMLDQATENWNDEDGRTHRVPAEVLRARRVAQGDESPPRGHKPKVDPTKRLDDYINRVLRDPSGSTGGTQVHRGN